MSEGDFTTAGRLDGGGRGLRDNMFPPCWDTDKPLAPPATGYYWALGS